MDDDRRRVSIGNSLLESLGLAECSTKILEESKMIKSTLFALVSTVFVVIGCGPAVKLPPVQEPLDSDE